MSYRDNQLSEQVTDSYEECYTIDVNTSFLTSQDRINEIDSEREEGSEDEAVTPILRPLSKTCVSRVSTTYDVTRSYHNQDTNSESERSPLSQSSEDDPHDNKHDEPTTPSRLLTLNSFDFMGDRDEDRISVSTHSNCNGKSGAESSHHSSHSTDSLGSDSIHRPGYDRGGDRCNQGVANDVNRMQHSPILAPAAQKEVFDVDMQTELTIHGDIVSDYTTQLTASLKTHMSEVMNKLTGQKVAELRGRDAFYTKELQKQQAIIEELEEAVSSCEERLLKEQAEVLRGSVVLEYACVRHRELYASRHSVMRLLHQWKLFVTGARKAASQHKQACRHRTKAVLREAFNELKKEADLLHAERRGLAEKNHFDKTVRDMVSRYEKQLAALTLELRESQEALGLEKARRQQLEEDLRRMFLKNMTVMNMEALSLFQTPTSAPPQLAEFGPARQEALAQQQAAEELQRQADMLAHMKLQQQLLKSHQHDYNTDQSARTVHAKSQTQDQAEVAKLVRVRRSGDDRSTSQSQRQQQQQKQQQHQRSQERVVIGRPDAGRRVQVTKSIRGSSSSISNSRGGEEWEEEEENGELPRARPLPLPYGASRR